MKRGKLQKTNKKKIAKKHVNSSVCGQDQNIQAPAWLVELILQDSSVIRVFWSIHVVHKCDLGSKVEKWTAHAQYSKMVFLKVESVGGRQTNNLFVVVLQFLCS